MSTPLLVLIIVVAVGAVLGPALALLALRRSPPQKPPEGGWKKWKDDE